MGDLASSSVRALIHSALFKDMQTDKGQTSLHLFFSDIIWIIFFSVFELFKKSEKTIVYLAMSTLWRAVTELNFKSDQGLSLPW